MILFAVTLAAILLSIALGVSEIAYKENTFGTSDKDTDNAFFAADSGAEQLLYNDKKGNYDPSLVPTGGLYTWPNVIITGLGNDGTSCAIANITKDSTGLATIISDGYNIGDSSCNSTSLNRVQREIKTTYAY